MSDSTNPASRDAANTAQKLSLRSVRGQLLMPESILAEAA